MLLTNDSSDLVKEGHRFEVIITVTSDTRKSTGVKCLDRRLRLSHRTLKTFATSNDW